MSENKPSNPKAKKARAIDTRPAHIIFAERFNNEARLMERRYAALVKLGNAKRAQPTQEQYEKAAEWLRASTERCIEEMGRKMRRNDVKPGDPETFKPVV